jgi:RNA polymerase subunit RPABC4/transcription elongation factor Spt4
MTLDPIFLQKLFTILGWYGVLFAIVLWLAVIRWTWQDISRRTERPAYRLLAALLPVLLFLPGVLIYLVLRPKMTLDENYQFSLEEEALLQTLDEYRVCPACEKPIQANWTFCPVCQTRIRSKCSGCGELLIPEWAICPVCGRQVLSSSTGGNSYISEHTDHSRDNNR